MILEIIIAFIATLGFGIIFNIKGKNLFFAAFGGALSWFIYVLCLQIGLTEISSLFLSSVIFSTYCEIFARILKTPITTLVVCALIPLVPGGGMYYTMFEVVTGDINKSLELGIKTLASAGVLAIGIIFVSTITRLIMSHKRKVDIKNFGQNS